MSRPLDATLDDAQIVDYICRWAIERSKCGLDSEKYNHINEKHLGPATHLLKQRGTISIAKVLPLLQHDNPDVRLAAAAIAYEVNKPACSKVMKDLMKTPDSIGMMAWATMAVLDRDNTPDPTELWGKE